MKLERVMKTSFALLVVLFATLVFADPPPPPEPPSVMEPQKLGPRTEQVDEKAYAKVVRVEAGGSIADTLTNITDASEKKRYAIFVAGGDYKGATIEMKPFVDLFGGFDAKAWKRDIEANRSVLDGEGQRRVVVGADNSKIDGFFIRNGKVRGPGAGVLCEHVSPTISNNTIIGNTAQEPESIHKEMYHQHGNDGGAIACINGSNAVITNNIIAGNTTDLGNGAGIAVANWSMPQVLNNVICNNTAGLTDTKRSRSSNGGGISASNALLRPPLRMRVINNVIANNYAGGNSDAGGVYCEYDSSPVIGANWILSNTAEDDGSAVYIMKSSHPLFTSNIVAGHFNHGAIRLSKEGRADIERNLMFGNGNALTCISSWMLLKNNTIVDNGSGVSLGNPYAPHLRPNVITGNVIYSNAGGQLGSESSGNDAPMVTKNDIEGGYPGEGNFDEKPRFARDGASGKIKSIDYDDERVVTTIATDSAGTAAGLNFDGRVISVGDKSGVIKQVRDGKLLVWGDVRPAKQQASEFNIAPTYRLADRIAAGDVGSHAKP
jgi:hypothetical protein